ncbi:MAG TPA: long-chain fatty acid--CoA ligase [Candidatus Thermoplasmatota archaeon]|nr:long-chain fatty acid--CoA ligase [Candidatus Thermoplasmatota archaeon]
MPHEDFLTLPEMFQKACARRGTAPALRRKADAGWKTITYAGYAQNVRDLSLGLQTLGVRPGDRVCLWSKNSPEWAVSDFATLHTGAATVPIYDTLTPDKAAYIVNDCGARLLIVQNEAMLEKLAPLRHDLKTVEAIVVLGPVSEKHRARDVYALDVAYAKGQVLDKEDPGRFERTWKAVKPSDLSSLIYTSGTTGNPKGVMLTHSNFCSNVKAVCEVLPVDEKDSTLSFLPLSHSFERTGGHFVIVHIGATIHYASSIEAVPQELMEVKPTFVTSVPRLYEKIYARILAQVEAGPNSKKKIFEWARGIGEQYARLVIDKKPVPLALKAKFAVADRLVFSKLRERTGGRIRFFVSGGAALAPQLQLFFSAAGLWILQGYGLSETSPVISVNSPDNNRIGSVGKAIPGVEVKIADDGEIWTRGPHVMTGYYNLPKETEEALTADGWFKTGDIGKVDDDGFLFVTDRKKELLVMSNGKKVPPQPIENDLKGRWVAQAVLLGTDRNFVSALLAPNFEELEKEAKAKGWSFASREELVGLPDARAIFQREVDRVNGTLSRYEQIKSFALLPRELTMDGGELTPTMKIKRKVVDKNFAKEIEAIYSAAPPKE